MKVTVKTSGLISRYVPGSESGLETEAPEGITVNGLMAQLGLPAQESYLVIVNDATVPKASREDHELHDGDRVAIVPPLKGG